MSETLTHDVYFELKNSLSLFINNYTEMEVSKDTSGIQSKGL